MPAASSIRLYHTGFEEIRSPDLKRGRKSADFGQGFYLTPNAEFAGRWAQLRRGACTYVNAYELDAAGLCVHRLERNTIWFDYIFTNRAGRPDRLMEADVIIGPIANDTIYETYGIITSGYLSRVEALPCCGSGRPMNKLVVKSEKALRRLKWVSSTVLTEAQVKANQEQLIKEQAAYQTRFADVMAGFG